MKVIPFACVLLALPAAAQVYPDYNSDRFLPGLKTVTCWRPQEQLHGHFMRCGRPDESVLLPLQGSHTTDYELMREYLCGLVKLSTGSQAVRCPTPTEKLKKI